MADDFDNLSVKAVKGTIMNIDRRHFLMSAAASVAFPGAVSAAADSQTLTAKAGSHQLAPINYMETGIWGFEGGCPGPLLRYRQGDRLRRNLVNELHIPTSVHWHGIRIDNAMDGVPGLTQDAVAPQAQFSYEFDLPDAGTYWYHAHNQSTEQVARGLYGALIVDEETPPDVDRDEILILDDWRLEDDAQLQPDFARRHDLSHGGRIGNLITTNSELDASYSVRKNERFRLRLINAANARIFVLALSGLEGWIVARDGMPLKQPEPITSEFLLAPAERIDVIVDVIAEEDVAHLVRIEGQNGYAQATFHISSQFAEVRREMPLPLPENPNSDLVSVSEANPTTLRMEGGAMGGLRQAVLNGEELGFGEIVQQGQFWALNGTVGMTESPLIEAASGEPQVIDIANDTAFPHAMHLHGHHFREVLADGRQGPMKDTLLVFRGESRRIAFVADNPGDWLLHCHMLSHQASGMKTWIRVNA